MNKLPSSLEIEEIINCHLFGMPLEDKDYCFGDRVGDDKIMGDLAKAIYKRIKEAK